MENVSESTKTTIGDAIEKKEPTAAEKMIEEKGSVNKEGEKKADGKKNKIKKKKKVIVISATAADAAVVATTEGGAKGCRVQVSNTKKPLFFYLNVAKRYIKQNNYVELSALGMAIPTVVTISEILKKDGWATEKKIGTSTVTLKDEAKGRVIMKAKIEILLERRKGSAASKGASVIHEREVSESNEKLLKKDQSKTDGTLAEKKDTQNTDMKVGDQGKNEIRSAHKTTSVGSNGDKENNKVAIAAAGN